MYYKQINLLSEKYSYKINLRHDMITKFVFINYYTMQNLIIFFQNIM